MKEYEVIQYHFVNAESEEDAINKVLDKLPPGSSIGAAWENGEGCMDHWLKMMDDIRGAFEKFMVISMQNEEDFDKQKKQMEQIHYRADELIRLLQIVKGFEA